MKNTRACMRGRPSVSLPFGTRSLTDAAPPLSFGKPLPAVLALSDRLPSMQLMFKAELMDFLPIPSVSTRSALATCYRIPTNESVWYLSPDKLSETIS